MSESQLYSMTGYGSSIGDISIGNVCIDLRTLNHRYLDININLPSTLQILYMDFRKVISDSFTRGNIYCHVLLTPNPEVTYVIDKNIMKHYMDTLSNAMYALNIPGEVDISLIMNLPGVLSQSKILESQLWGEIEPLLKSAIAEAVRSRRDEGKALGDILLSMTNSLENNLKTIEMEFKKSKSTIMATIKTRLNEFLKAELNKERLEEEAAIQAQRADIQEEIDRLGEHISFFCRTLEAGGVCGRKMDFILQEMSREINTILSKTPLSEIKRSAIEIKCTVEQMREQVQNIE